MNDKFFDEYEPDNEYDNFDYSYETNGCSAEFNKQLAEQNTIVANTSVELQAKIEHVVIDQIEENTTPAVDTPRQEATQKDKKEKANPIVECLKILDSFPKYRNNLNELFYLITDGEHKEMLPLNSKLLLGYIQDRLAREKGVFLRPKDYYSSFSMIEYRASKVKLEKCELINRVRGDDNYLYIDMYETPTSFLRFNKQTGQHDYVPHTPFARFVHDAGRQLQRIQVSDGNALPQFFALHSINDVLDQALIVGTVIAQFYEDIVVPYLWVLGSQGSGKTTLIRCIRDIIDPAGKTIHMPRKIDHLAQVLTHNFFPALDNLGKISFEYSNFLCNACTGTNYPTRTLYTNAGDYIFEVKTSGLFASIKTFDIEPDLLSRIFFIRRKDIVNSYDSGTEIDKLSFEIQPQVLFEILHIYRQTLQYDFREYINRGERNADFSGVLKLACKTYFNDETLADEIILRNKEYKGIEQKYGNPVVAVIVEFMKNKPSWRGSISELMASLAEKGLGTPDVPPTPNSFSRAIKDNLNDLARYGITINKLKKVATNQPYEFVNTNLLSEHDDIGPNVFPELYMQQ